MVVLMKMQRQHSVLCGFLNGGILCYLYVEDGVSDDVQALLKPSHL
jgi:hypothetical protein